MAKLRTARTNLRVEDERKYTALLGVVTLAAAIWVGFLAFANARERQAEIGILRAMGARTSSILGALLGRAFLVGFIGAGLALLLAFLLSENLSEGPLQGFDLRSLQADVPLILFSAPILACAASWLPALQASNRDPATILRND